MNMVNKIIMHQNSIFFWTQLLSHPLNQHLFNFVQGTLEVFQLYIWHNPWVYLHTLLLMFQ